MEGPEYRGGGGTPPPAIAAPRLIAPLSTATVTSRQPTLHWSLAAGTDGAHIDICAERGCTTKIVEFNAAGESSAPPSTLPPGVLFWRAYGRNLGAAGDTPSPTWQLVVGVRSAPGVDASWGTTLDVNGDGHADIAVGAPNAGHVYVFLGGPGPVPLTTNLQITLPPVADDNSQFGGSIASAGDVNGDGYADVIVGASGSNSAYLYLGSPIGIELSSQPQMLLGPDGGFFGESVAKVPETSTETAMPMS